MSTTRNDNGKYVMSIIAFKNPKKLMRVAKKLIYKNYGFILRWKYLKYWVAHTRLKNPLIIYQMGKVGSSTLAKSLREACTDYEIFQVHFLTKEFINRVDKQYRDASKACNKIIIDQHLLESMYLEKKIIHRPIQSKWKVITIVRDPIARNISSFFQAFPIYFAKENADIQNNNLTQKEKIDLMIELFINKFERHNVPLEWFDVHMKPVFNIDVYEQDFQRSHGYAIYNIDKVDLLLLRLEDLNKCTKEAFYKFLSIENFELVHANISSDKAYSSNYSLFKDKLKLPKSYVSEMYNSKYMRHFYTEEEINIFSSKWSN